MQAKIDWIAAVADARGIVIHKNLRADHPGAPSVMETTVLLLPHTGYRHMMNGSETEMQG